MCISLSLYIYIYICIHINIHATHPHGACGAVRRPTSLWTGDPLARAGPDSFYGPAP